MSALKIFAGPDQLSANPEVNKLMGEVRARLRADRAFELLEYDRLQSDTWSDVSRAEMSCLEKSNVFLAVCAEASFLLPGYLGIAARMNKFTSIVLIDDFLDAYERKEVELLRATHPEWSSTFDIILGKNHLPALAERILSIVREDARLHAA